MAGLAPYTQLRICWSFAEKPLGALENPEYLKPKLTIRPLEYSKNGRKHMCIVYGLCLKINSLVVLFFLWLVFDFCLHLLMAVNVKPVPLKCMIRIPQAKNTTPRYTQDNLIHILVQQRFSKIPSAVCKSLNRHIRPMLCSTAQ